jgi:hypothetical protein
MATQVQFRRGTTSQNNAFTGAIGELTYDTEVKTLRLHDGSSAGGGAVVATLAAAQTFTNKTLSTNSVWQGTAVGLAYGGTNANITAAAGAVVYSTASALGVSLAGTSGQVLTSGGTAAPTWVAQSSLTVGTATTATRAVNIDGGSPGYLVYQIDTNDTGFIPPGETGYLLRSTGASTAPDWVAANLTIGSTAVALGTTVTSFAGLNILAATGTSHWTVPNGTTEQRPGSPAAGMIRYNSTQSTFEGYSSGAWSSLGGVKSVDAFTYILAETSAGASNGDLDFYAENSAGNAATQVGQWNRTNLKDYTGTIVGTQTTQNVFNATATTVNAFGAATTLTIGGTSGTATIRNGTVAVTNNATVGGTLSVTGDQTNTGDLAVNGGDLTTTATTASLFNANATTLNIGQAGTTISIGATSGTTTVRNNLTVTGDLTINGTTTTVNATTITVDDKNIELGSVASPSNTTADGGGITLKGATDKTLNWVNATGAWTSSEDFNLVTGKNYEINAVNVLDASSVLGSATTATVAGAATTLTIGGTSGTATIRNSTVAITNNATVGGTLGVTSTSTFTGQTTHNGGISVNGNITLASNGNATVGGTLGVTGATTLTGALAANGGITVDSTNFTVNGTTGAVSTASTMDVGTNATVGGTLGVTGVTTLTGLVNANGGIAVDTNAFTVADTTGNTVVGGTLDVTGVVNFNNTTDATSSTAGGAVTIDGGLAVAKKLFVGGNADFDGNVLIDGSLTVSGTTTTITATNLSVSDNMIYMNQAVQSTITNAVGNGTNVVYTTSANHNYLNGMTVSITGVTPSAYNLSDQTITAVTSNTFTVANAATGTYVSGGTARARSNANPDLGFAFGYNDGTYHHGGLFRDATDGVFKFFKGYDPEPDASAFIDTADASFEFADLRSAAFTATSGTFSTTLGVTGETTLLSTLHLGHASDTTLARSAAGVVTIEGVEIVTLSRSQTLTNKTLTSPTLTTPVLGTPSSGTLTSCTGLPISTGVSGLGTGVATFLATPSSANLISAITDETGSGALVFGTSPTFTTSVVAGSSTMAVFNTTATTVNAFGAATTLSLGAATGTTTVNNSLTITGDLVVNGTTTTVNSTNVSIDNNIFNLGGDTAPSVDDAKDRGMSFRWHNGTAAKQGFFGWDRSTSRFSFVPDATFASDVVSGTQGDIDINNIFINGTAATGTGGVVRATSPTLVTPVLGTPSSGTLTNCTGLPVSGITASTSTALGVGSIELGHASDTTLARSAAGVVTIEGVEIVTLSRSQTLTNKTLTSPVISTISNTGTLTLPTSTDTLVGRATTDTLTNKTLTSPTLTTPVLGTPSSGTLSNCTGLPVATGISGLGTGVATFLATPSSANLISAITDETGSGALVFANTPTLVTPNIGAATGTSLTTTGGGLLARAAATQDGIEIRGRAGGTGNWEVILTPTTLSADRTLTAPDVSGTIVTTGDTGSVTNTMLAGSIANAKLTNSSVTVGSTAISLGSSATTIAGLSSVTSTSFVGALTGNASTATSAATLTTPRAIQGVNFDGSAAITVLTAGTGVSVSGTQVSIGQAVATSSNVQFNSLGVGTAGSATAGEIRATNAITSFYSDERLKENITEIDNAINKVMSLRGVTYTSNQLAESFGYTNKEEQVGVIAQDVEKVLPQIVKPAPFDIISLQEGIEISRSGENYKTVQYEKLVPLLIQAIKEQQVMIEELQKKVGN